MTEKRSGTAGNAHAQGVGARQTNPSASAAGGGYLEIYTFSEFGFRRSEKNHAAAPPEKDPRLQQLHEIGLNHIWQEIAGAIGYDNFIKMWISTHSRAKAAGLINSSYIGVEIFQLTAARRRLAHASY